MHTHTRTRLHLYANADTGTRVSSALLLPPALPMQILPVQSCTMQIPSPGPQVPSAMQMAMQGEGGQHCTAQAVASPLRLVPCQPGTALVTAARSDVGDVGV